MDLPVLCHLPTTLPAPLADAAMLVVFLLAVGVTAMASVGFVVWFIYQVLRLIVVGIARLVMITGSAPARRPAPVTPQWLACPDPVCRCVNPHHARFCRQCGRMIHKSARFVA